MSQNTSGGQGGESVTWVGSELRDEGRRRMAGNTLAFLRNHAPFNKMSAEALQIFGEKAQIVFYPAASEIIGPDAGNVRYFYLIESGKVQARQAGEVAVTEYSILSLGAGESFPIGAVTAGRPSTNIYVGSSRVDLQACKLEYSIVSPK